MKDQKAVSLLGVFLNQWVKILYVQRVFLRLDIRAVNVRAQWTWSVDRGDGGEINDALWFCSLAEVLGSSFCELEDPRPFASLEDVFVNLLVIKINLVRM